MYEAARETRGGEDADAITSGWRSEGTANRKAAIAAPKPKSKPKGPVRVYTMDEEELGRHKTAMVNLLKSGENFQGVFDAVAEAGLINQTLLDLLDDRLEVPAPRVASRAVSL